MVERKNNFVLQNTPKYQFRPTINQKSKELSKSRSRDKQRTSDLNTIDSQIDSKEYKEYKIEKLVNRKILVNKYLRKMNEVCGEIDEQLNFSEYSKIMYKLGYFDQKN